VVTTFVLVLILYVAQFLQNVFGASTAIGNVFQYLSLQSHMDDLMKGVVDSKDIIYYLSIIIGCLFISTRLIESRRWS
jgi:gliding motility-associated transport system permease protein